MKRITILADVWGQIYLFHPALVRHPPLHWDEVLLRAIPAVERARSLSDLVAVLNSLLFQPLRDPSSSATLSPVRPATSATGLRRVHEGWNEHGRPYIYRQAWQNVAEYACDPHITKVYAEGLHVHIHTTLAWPTAEAPPPLAFPSPGAKRARPMNQYRSSKLTQSRKAAKGWHTYAKNVAPLCLCVKQPVLSKRLWPMNRAARLLGLCKTWSVLAALFPLSNEELGEEWLAHWLPLIAAAPDQASFYHHMNVLAATLHDGHATAWHPDLHALPAPPVQAAEPHLPFPVPEAVRHLRKLGSDLAYMNPFAIPDRQTLREAFALLTGIRGLILDLRGYPRCHFPQELIRCLCRATVVSPCYAIPRICHPNHEFRQWRHIQYTVTPDCAYPLFSGPVVALIDATTQSAAEDFAMYLRNAERAVFVGAATPGCHGNAAYIDLPDGGWFSFSGMRVTWPDGAPFQGIGLAPDVAVDADATEYDNILAAGVEVLTRLVREPHGHTQ
ncbi:MAG: hypothetical protein EI684_17265 [Candidatus Viridilinea halotolerans]|uniref:Tail specific protease domain-containing protein n=1 Tax=Candidatus Viridilinea halotolerans TaxID=2491704 RepID=A0A426TU85_9CHLR|nr:MAG: hypothetical protein EI684_17265 [Candidatus Viridilinea halotolerans]